MAALAMLNLGKQLAMSHTVASQFIGHDHARHILKAFKQSSEESFGGPGITPGLNEDVEHDTVLIHCTPQIVVHALNPDEHLIEVPLVTGPRTAAAQSAGKTLTEFLAPAPDSLIGDDDATLGQQQFNISQAEAEHVIQPDSMADEIGWKPMAVVGVRRRLHAASLAGLKPVGQSGLP
jgi:hypothetical protein